MAKPFLKWAGGKRQLISEIEKRLPPNINEIETYVEPFIGGGALLFHMLENYSFEQVHISDINLELVLCYRQLQSSVDDVISSLENLVRKFPTITEERSDYYYKIRDLWNSNLDIESMTNEQKSSRVAQMIFLNKTCFNGLFRLNRSGKFNVPTGRYKNPSFPSAESLKEVSHALQGVAIHHASYEKCLDWIDDMSFAYFDPPYRPLSKTSSFISYSKGDFDDKNQTELANLTKELDKMSVLFLLSNSDPKNTVKDDEFFDDLYSDFNIERVFASRAINSNPERRGKISELMIKNY
jgi:DNA adenine methylase